MTLLMGIFLIYALADYEMIFPPPMRILYKEVFHTFSSSSCTWIYNSDETDVIIFTHSHILCYVLVALLNYVGCLSFGKTYVSFLFVALCILIIGIYSFKLHEVYLYDVYLHIFTNKQYPVCKFIEVAYAISFAVCNAITRFSSKLSQ